MNKNISVERLFSLGDFRNIKFVSTVTDIPRDILLNKKGMSLLWYLQLLEIEESRHKYDLLSRKIIDTDHENIAKMIEEERTQTYEDFMNSLVEEN